MPSEFHALIFVLSAAIEMNDKPQMAKVMPAATPLGSTASDCPGLPRRWWSRSMSRALLKQNKKPAASDIGIYLKAKSAEVSEPLSSAVMELRRSLVANENTADIREHLAAIDIQAAKIDPRWVALMPNPNASPAINAYAAALASVEREYRTATNLLVTAETHRQLIDERLAALAAQRAKIIARRAAGRIEPDDAGELALIASDSEARKAMKSDADAGVAAALLPALAGQHAIDHARGRQAHSEAAATEPALVAHAGESESRLLETIAWLAQDGAARSRRRPEWDPSPILSEALRDLQVRLGKT